MSEQENSSIEVVERALRLAKRRWWLVLTVAGSVTAAGVTVLDRLPNRYTSEATLVVVRQQVPERYVIPTSTTDIGAALQAMKREVLARAPLLKIIEDFHLYTKQKSRPGGAAPETLVSLMLQDIDIQPLDENPARRDFSAFKISYVGDSSQTTHDVVSTLTALFINENLRSRGEQATNTTRFLHEQVQEKGKRLQQQEQLLRDFKLQHVGELPEQQPGNLGILQGLQNQLQATTNGLSRAEEQRVYLESLLNTYQRQAAAVTAAEGMGAASGAQPAGRPLTPLETAQAELSRLQASRSGMVARGYTSEHPDLKRADRDIAQVQETVGRLRASRAPAGDGSGRPATARAASNTPEDPAIAQARSQLEARKVEIENLAREEKRLKTAIAQYEGRLNMTPVREAQQAGIVRDTEALRMEYADLLKKEQESQLASNLEQEQGGQQFRLVDPPSLPRVPSSPNRLKLSGGVVAAGLALGLLLAIVLELRDSSFHSDRELQAHLHAPYVIELPQLPTAAEALVRKRTLALQFVSGCAMSAVMLAAEFYVYRRR